MSSPGLFREYYKNPQATARSEGRRGLVPHRRRRLLRRRRPPQDHRPREGRRRLADGTLFAPKYLENKLKFFPFIKEAVCFGHGRDQVCAFINIDLEAVGNWAERRNMPYSGYTDLACADAGATT